MQLDLRNLSQRRRFLLALLGTALAALNSTVALGQSFNFNTGSQSWNVAGNWTPSGFPNAVGASATFGSLTGTATVNLGAAITVGSITQSNNGNFVRSIANGGGSLIIDATGSGEATITNNGTSTTTNNLTISASTTLNDTLRFTNNNVSGTGSATATMTGTVTGSGGFIKDGPGRFSFSSVAKTYTGATTVNQGRLRMTGSGQMTGTSSITVNSGGSLYLDGNSGVWAFGTTPASTSVAIAGDGDNGGGTGTQGALRNQGSGTNTFANPLSLNANATIHTEGSSVLQLNGGFSGASTLTKSGGGTLQYTAANAGLTGGTIATNGTILVNVASQLGAGALSFAQTSLNNPTVTLNNAVQSISSLSSTFVDVVGTQTQTLTLNGTALSINQSVDTTFGAGAVPTLASIITGTGGVSKSGLGVLTLSSANAYTGTTTVSQGTLVVNGDQTAATGNVSVQSTATFGGSGVIGGDTVIQGGAFHTPGNSPGAQTFNNADLTYNSSSTFVWELISDTNSTFADFDRVLATGLTPGVLTIDPAANSQLVFNGSGSSVDWDATFWSSDKQWLVYSGFSDVAGDTVFANPVVASLLDGDGESFGDVSNQTSLSSFTWSTSGNNVFLNYNFTAVPEPTGLGGALTLLGTWVLRRRRKAS